VLRSLAVAFAVLPILLLAAEASAHQDGCHRSRLHRPDRRIT